MIVRLGDLTTKMCHYFEQSSGFWEKLELSISFIRVLITIITKVNQISSFENLENFDEERLLKVLILRFEEVLIRSESPVIDKLRILLGCAIQSMCGMGLNGSSIALRLDFPGRLTNELAKFQIKISLIKFRQLSETSYGQLIFIIFSIMRNMVYKQRALKENLAKTDFIPIVSRLWSHCLGQEKLIRALLQMIHNLTHDCISTSTRVANSQLMTQMIKQFHSYNSQIKVKIKINSIFGLIFKALNNLSVSPEARAVLWKGNVLGVFTKACDCALHSNRSRQQALALKFWLQLLLAVSYHRDGQEQILAIEDILEYLSDIYHHSQDDKMAVLLIQHNLCYLSHARIRITQHNQTLSCLAQALTPDEPLRLQQVAASACWSLMGSSQKAKGLLKAKGFGNKLETAITILKKENILDSGVSNTFSAAFELINS
jgi:hypothetical protein